MQFKNILFFVIGLICLTLGKNEENIDDSMNAFIGHINLSIYTAEIILSNTERSMYLNYDHLYTSSKDELHVLDKAIIANSDYPECTKPALEVWHNLYEYISNLVELCNIQSSNEIEKKIIHIEELLVTATESFVTCKDSDDYVVCMQETFDTISEDLAVQMTALGTEPGKLVKDEVTCLNTAYSNYILWTADGAIKAMNACVANQ